MTTSSNPSGPDIRAEREGSLLLHLPVDGYAFSAVPALRVGDADMRKKSELHLTLLNAEALQRIGEVIDESSLLRMAADLDWTIVRSGDGALIASRDDGQARYSLVEWVELPAFHAFRSALARVSGTALPDTLPHITHYASDSEGIGLPDLACIERLKQADLRLPGIGGRTPRASAAKVEASFADGSSLLPPDTIVRLGQQDGAIDAWLQRHQADAALLFSAADPFDCAASPRGNAVRWALLDAELAAQKIRAVPVLGKEDADEPARVSLCLLDLDDAAADRLLRRYEQLAAVHVQRKAAPELLLHPAIRENHA